MLFAEPQKIMRSPRVDLRRGLKPEILAYILPPEMLVIVSGKMDKLAARGPVHRHRYAGRNDRHRGRPGSNEKW